MGFEYRAALALLPARGAGLLDSLAAQKGWAVVSRAEGAIALRFADRPARKDWPQDFDLALDAKGVVLVIHSGTRQEREQIVSRVAALLTTLSPEARLEEL